MSHPPQSKPARAAHRTDSASGADATMAEFSLEMGAGYVGLSLRNPVLLGPVSVEHVRIAFDGIRFPLDVSGGVAKFRSRRGSLQEARVVLSPERLAPLVAAAARAVGFVQAHVHLVPTDTGIAIATVWAREPDEPSILVWELEPYPSEDALELWIGHARGTNLPMAATEAAMRVTKELLGGVGTPMGLGFRVSDPVRHLLLSLVPLSGIRAPDTKGAHLESIERSEGNWHLTFCRASPPGPPSAAAVRAREVGRALGRVYDLPPAELRQWLLTRVDRTAKSPIVLRLLAEQDALAGRVDAAIDALALSSDPRDRGLLAELRAAAGDVEGAEAAYNHAATIEPLGPLAAHYWRRSAELAARDEDRIARLDSAVARAPLDPDIRQRRLAVRTRTGDLAGARADADHLEALASEPMDKASACALAAQTFADAGLLAESARLLGRALRFQPDAWHLLTRLGAVLLADGKAARALSVLDRAVARAEHVRSSLHNEDFAWLALSVAETLAALGDYHGAVMRVRSVSTDRHAMRARLLEGAWHNALGQRDGAIVAWSHVVTDLASRKPLDRELVPMVCSAIDALHAHDEHALAQHFLALALCQHPEDTALLARGGTQG